VIRVTVGPNARATIRSFHVHRNRKIASEAIAASPSVRIRRKKICSSDTPSMSADSRTSRGMDP
jgi:hypothetical protein